MRGAKDWGIAKVYCGLFAWKYTEPRKFPGTGHFVLPAGREVPSASYQAG